MVRLVSLISGGIDSAASTALAAEQTEVTAVYMKNSESNASLEKVKNILKAIEEKTGKKIELIVVDFMPAVKEIAEHADSKYRCILCKRMMLRVAEKIALEKKADALVMGDSLGQVASQTLTNMAVISQAVKIPIARPLVGMDKLEIEGIGKEYGTFDISIRKAPGCGLLPERVSTKAKLEKILEDEKKLDAEKLLERIKY